MASNSIVGPLLTDLYQLHMAYAYWKVQSYKFNSGHLNILFFFTCTDFIGSCGGELLDITHTNKLIIY